MARHLTCRTRTSPVAAAVNVLAFTPDGKTLVTGGDDHLVRTWDMTGAEPREKLVPKGAVGSLGAVAFAPDGRTLAAGGDDHVVRLWDLAEPSPAGQPPAPKAEIAPRRPDPGAGLQPRRQEARLRRRGLGSGRGRVRAAVRARPLRHPVPRVCAGRQDPDRGQ